MNVAINWWAVILATASSMVVGTIWYARSVFGNTWMKLAKVDSKKIGNPTRSIIVTVIVSFITAYVLAHMTYVSHNFFNDTYFVDAVLTAFWLWLGFTAARFVTHDAFEGRPIKLTLINCAHELVTLVVMGAIIG